MLTMFREHLADELQRFPEQPGRSFESYAVTMAALTRMIHFRVLWPEMVMPGDTKPKWIMVYSDRTGR